MFPDTDNTKDAFQWLFDRELPSIRSTLSRDAKARKLDTHCPECGGLLWEYDNDVVCQECSTVIGSDEPTTSSTNLWDEFEQNRSHHSNSSRKRCVGGFPHVYDWNTDSEDNPADFYV